MPRYTQPRKTWFYPVNFKIKAVELSLRDDVMSKDVAEALDIHPLMMSRWRKEYREGNKLDTHSNFCSLANSVLGFHQCENKQGVSWQSQESVK